MSDDQNTNSAAQTGQTSDAAGNANPGAVTPKPTYPPSQAQLAAQAKGHTFLPQVQNFEIPDLIFEQYPELVNLILETESMNDEERIYWFQILPVMTDEQVLKFKEILETEKKQLLQLDQEYEQELTKLNDKHMVEWKEFEVKEKRKQLEEAEQAEETEEEKKQAALLQQLDEV